MTTYIIVPSTSVDYSVGIPTVVALVLGAIAGGFFAAVAGGGAASGAGAAFAIALGLFKIAGNFVGNLAPTSEVLYLLGWTIRWIFGLYFAFFAGIGGFAGGGVVWLVIYIYSDLHHALTANQVHR